MSLASRRSVNGTINSSASTSKDSRSLVYRRYSPAEGTATGSRLRIWTIGSPIVAWPCFHRSRSSSGIARPKGPSLPPHQVCSFEKRRIRAPDRPLRRRDFQRRSWKSHNLSFLLSFSARVKRAAFKLSGAVARHAHAEEKNLPS